MFIFSGYIQRLSLVWKKVSGEISNPANVFSSDDFSITDVCQCTCYIFKDDGNYFLLTGIGICWHNYTAGPSVEKLTDYSIASSRFLP